MKKLLLALACSTLFAGTIKADSVSQAIELQDAFSQVADKAFPAVVVIDVFKKIDQPRQMNQIPPGFEFFFGPRHHYRQQPGQEQEQPQREARGSGSGFIINKEGYIVTNHHVVAESDKIIVKFKDNREYKAKLIGTDKKSDLAVIKIEADRDLPFLRLANSDNVRVGHWAIAIGAPFNMDYSMTVGVVRISTYL